jgi:hypothetical protein
MENVTQGLARRDIAMFGISFYMRKAQEGQEGQASGSQSASLMSQPREP